MNITVMPITSARINLGSVVQKVASGGSSVILERAGKQIAAIINMEMLEDITDGVDLAYSKKTCKATTDWNSIKHKYGV